jgi:hypothetical protein
MRTITLVPAYGRDYTSAKAVKADFEANKDFIIADLFSGSDGRYANKQDLQKDFDQVTLRYSRLAKLTTVRL